MIVFSSFPLNTGLLRMCQCSGIEVILNLLHDTVRNGMMVHVQNSEVVYEINGCLFNSLDKTCNKVVFLWKTPLSFEE